MKRWLTVVAAMLILLPQAAYSASAPPRILLVMDSHYCPSNLPSGAKCTNSQVEPFYTAMLTANSLSYDICTVPDKDKSGPRYEGGGSTCSGNALRNYDIVIWVTGLFASGYPTFTDQDQEELVEYLNSGGRLFAIGQDIGADIRHEGQRKLYELYLHADPQVFLDDANDQITVLKSDSADPISSGPDFEITGGANNQLQPSVVVPTKNLTMSGNVSISFFWAKGLTHIIDVVGGRSKRHVFTEPTAAALRVNTGTYKLVYFSFSLESTKPESQRNTIMKRVIDYLYTSSVSGLNVTKNPANRNTTLTATCSTSQLFANITAAEFFINSPVAAGSGFALNAADGAFSGAGETVNATLDINLFNEGLNNVSVRCKDTDGYWSRVDNITVTKDTTPPSPPDMTIDGTIVGGSKYTNRVKPLITISFNASDPPSLVAFSCDGKGNNWTEFSASSPTFSEFNMTSGACNVTDGEKPVYIHSQDAAGNIQSLNNSKDIILDRVAPTISATPANGSSIRSSREILIPVSDASSGAPSAGHSFDSGNGTNVSFSSNVSFSHGLVSGGTRQLTVFAKDNAGNINVTVLTYIVDDAPPSISLSAPANSSYIRTSTNLTIVAADTLSSINTLVFNNNDGSGNTTFSSNAAFDPLWTTEGNKTIEIWANDSAGNTNRTSFSFAVDDTPPVIGSISPANGSNTTGSRGFSISFSDAVSGVNRSFFDSGNGTNITLSNSSLFLPGFQQDGKVVLTVYLTDNAGNTNISRFNFTNDNAPPNTTDNYSSTQWSSANQTVRLSCSDNVTACSATLYCIHDSTQVQCSPSVIGTDLTAGCNSNSVCRLFVRYSSNDTVGNTETAKNSSQILIDRKAPSISIISPKAGVSFSGIVDLIANITDEGVGSALYNNASYSILNSSNLSQVFASGNLTASAGWNATWNSSQATSGIAIFILNITAADNLSNSRSSNVTFTVDNTKPTAVIRSPDGSYLRANFPLDAEGKSAPSGANLTRCSYFIFNSTSIVNFSSAVLNSTSCTFTNQVPVSLFADGNYSFNMTANDSSGKDSTALTWLFIDTRAPQISISSPSNMSWSNGTVNISFTASDSVSLSSCRWRWRQQNTSDYFTADCGSTFAFDTRLCGDTNSSNCTLQVAGADAAGNENSSEIALNVDNSPPSVSITAPPASGYRSANFSVAFSASDISNLTCEYRVQNTNWSGDSGWRQTACGQNFTADISFCQAEGADRCQVSVRARNIVTMESAASRNFSIDLTKPFISSITPANGTLIRPDRSMSITLSDGLSGIPAGRSFFNRGNGTNVSFSSSPFQVFFASDGLSNLTVYFEDVAGNSNSTIFFFTVDGTPPNASAFSFNITDPSFNDSRVSPSGTIEFRLNANDSSNISSVVAAISYSGTEQNFSLSSANSPSNGTWNFSFTNTTGTGPYSVSALFLNDSLGNSRSLNSGQINRSFLVVNSTISVLVGSLDSINASANATLNITLSFNKTVSSPSASVSMPSGHSNISAFSCSFGSGCTMAGLSAAGNGSGISITASASVKASAPANDTNATWLVQFSSQNFSAPTMIATPFLNFSNISCDGASPCRASQHMPFSVFVEVENIRQQVNHTGTARHVNISFSSEAGRNSTLIAEIPSGSRANATFILNSSAAGNITFSFNATELIGSAYSSAPNRTVQIADREAPNISSYSADDSIINLNETLTALIVVSDNLNVSSVWATVNSSGGSLANHTLTLSSGSGQLGTWNLSFNSTSVAGNYTILYAYANDTANNIASAEVNISFEALQLTVNYTISNSSPHVNSSIFIEVNVTGNASEITSKSVLIVKPRGFNETLHLSLNSTPGGILRFTGTYSNISRSGNYSAILNLLSEAPFSGERNFSVQPGRPSVEFAGGNRTHVTIPRFSVFNMSWFSIPVGGDLLNTTASISFSNSSVLNISGGDNTSKSFGNVTFESSPDGSALYFRVNATEQGVTTATITVNTTGGSNTSSVTVNVTASDQQAPSISSISADFSQINLLENVRIVLRAADSSVINTSVFEITYPNGTRANFTGTQTAFDSFRLDFSGADSTGIYNYSGFVADISGNANASSSGSFTVYSNYTVDVSAPFTVYNKGENITFSISVRNANNATVSGFLATVVLNKNGTLATILNNVSSTASYFITSDDSPASTSANATYSATVNVSKNGNAGSSSKTLTVSRLLSIDYLTPLTGTSFSVSADVAVQVRVKNARGEGAGDVRVSATCGECDSSAFLDHEGSGVYSNSRAFSAPDSANFGIVTFSIDSAKNSQSSSSGEPVVLVTGSGSSSSSSTSSSGGGGGGGGGGGSAAASTTLRKEGETCDETALICIGPFICSGGVCMRPGITLTENFSVVFPDNVHEIVQGESAFGEIFVRNEGPENQRIPISFSESPCCVIRMPSVIDLPSYGSEISVKVEIHVPLYVKRGEYFVSVKIGDKERLLKVRVRDSQNVDRIPDLERAFASLKNETMVLKALGIEGGDLEDHLEIIDKALEKARFAVLKDNKEELAIALRIIEDHFIYTKLGVVRFWLAQILLSNAPAVVAISVSGFFGSYISASIIMPYLRLRKTLSRLLKEQESIRESRKAAEIQYFRRRLDEHTFRNIMVQKQDSLLSVNAHIKDVQNEKSSLMRNAFTAQSLRMFSSSASSRLKAKMTGRPSGKAAATPASFPGAPAKYQQQPNRETEQVQRPERSSPPATSPPAKPVQNAALKARLQSAEMKISEMAGNTEKREEAAENLGLARLFAERGLDVMAAYYLERCEKIINA